MMEYKGYAAGPIDFDQGENTFSGTVAGLKDVIHFEGSTAKKLTRAFRDSIDSYLKFCKETGQKPDRPFSGKILCERTPVVPEGGFARRCRGRQPEPMDFALCRVRTAAASSFSNTRVSFHSIQASVMLWP